MARKQRTGFLYLLLLLLAAVALLIWLLPDVSDKSRAEDPFVVSTLAHAGDMAPDFTVELFDGGTLTLSDLQGKVVLLDFWATWCPPCRQELARVQAEVIDRFAGEDFVFLPVSRGEDRETVAAFRSKHGHRFPMGLDPTQKIYRLYASNYIPRNFLIDREGRIALTKVGYLPGEFDALVRQVDSLLHQPR